MTETDIWMSKAETFKIEFETSWDQDPSLENYNPATYYDKSYDIDNFNHWNNLKMTDICTETEF